MAETVEELQKKMEDIKTLLKTLEEAYNDASITEEHYKEVKEKNEKSLQDIEARIKKISGDLAGKEEGAEAAPKEEAAEEGEKKGGRPKKEKGEKKPKTVGEMIAAEMEVPVSQSVEEESVAGIPIGDKEKPEEEASAEEKPTEPPAKGKDAGGLSSKDLEDVLQKFVKELRPETSGIGEKLEKLAVQFEKLRTFVDAMKDEKSDTQENLRRIMEEIGEIRSTVNSLESRTSEQEIKMEEAISTMKYLKTDQFVRDLQKKETELKTHEARIDKDICDGCQDCIDNCNFDAINMTRVTGSKKLKAEVDPEACYGCGCCYMVCESKAISMECVRPVSHVPGIEV